MQPDSPNELQGCSSKSSMAATDGHPHGSLHSVHLLHLTLGLKLLVKLDTSSTYVCMKLPPSLKQGFFTYLLPHITSQSVQVLICVGASRKVEKEGFLVSTRER